MNSLVKAALVAVALEIAGGPAPREVFPPRFFWLSLMVWGVSQDHNLSSAVAVRCV
jgi:hypothetical protein